MKNTVVKEKTASQEVVKPVKQDIKLDLDRVLEQVWNQGLPNGISSPY